MRMLTAVAAAASLVVQMSGPAWAQSGITPAATPPPKPLTTCEGLMRDWRAIEYELADNYAEGIADNSAPRATMRAARNTEAYVRAEITLNLMIANKCSLPKRAPSEMTYSLNAIKCSTEKLKGNFKSPECEYYWTPIGQ